jgi:hypothetical protein
LDWERFAPEVADSEIYGIASSDRNDTFYFAGMEKPPINEKRAGSYFARVQTNGTLEVFDRDREIGGAGVVWLRQ